MIAFMTLGYRKAWDLRPRRLTRCRFPSKIVLALTIADVSHYRVCDSVSGLNGITFTSINNKRALYTAWVCRQLGGCRQLVKNAYRFRANIGSHEHSRWIVAIAIEQFSLDLGFDQESLYHGFGASAMTTV